jgi:hypothetical protein
MDWDLAIKRNSEALKGIIEALFAMLGLDGEATLARIPQSLHSAVLRVLRPAESAMRRLIIIAARGLVVKLAPSRAVPAGPIGKGGPIRQSGGSTPSFQLFDPRKNFASPRRRKYTRNPPRIHFFGNDQIFASDPRVATLWEARPRAPDPAPPPDGLMGAERLTRRLQALKLALDDRRARPGVSPAGGRGVRTQKVRSSPHRSGRAVLPATAGSRFTWSMKYSSNAMGSPLTQ